MEEITIESLFTVAGASLATGLLVQVTKLFVTVTDQWARRLAVLYAVAILMIAAISPGPPDGTNVILFFLAAFLNGLVAGLAASSAFETARHGDARKVLSPDTYTEMAAAAGVATEST